jgi:hypothetical protein
MVPVAVRLVCTPLRVYLSSYLFSLRAISRCVGGTGQHDRISSKCVFPQNMTDSLTPVRRIDKLLATVAADDGCPICGR